MSETRSATTLAQALTNAGAMGLDRLDAHWLLGHVLGRSRAWLLAHDGDGLSPAQAATYNNLCQRRALGEPFAYLVGMQEFHGLQLAVSPAVLVPRPDTEILVDWGLELLAGELAERRQPRVIDLGTGSGAVALAVRHAWPAAQLTALDCNPDALSVALGNAEHLGLPVTFQEGDWWQAVPGQAFDLALSNPPYIAGDDAHLDALRHEPSQALTPGGDGLGALRQIILGAPQHLAPGAWLVLEHGWDQAAPVRQLLEVAGFEAVTSRKDLASHERCSGGRWRPRNGA